MNKQSKHIIVAEDEAFLLDMMKIALSKHGARVSTAQNGQEAIDLIDKDPPDLLLLDLLMPQVDGFAVLQHRKDKNLKFPVVVCSNLSDKPSIIKCNEFDVNEYLIKSDMDDEQIWTVAEKYLH
ncbi:hypothetical protein A2635_01830 [Candidatus Peribacteria bacterium RIFCSPHIGHO2_01_FULL_51_9]|nr:MAG: hypothetical protein A2635_01830 [Candidatus Peribacteria bacterium RIFCSPHIGHO2_01_FULL_51_9]